MPPNEDDQRCASEQPESTLTVSMAASLAALERQNETYRKELQETNQKHQLMRQNLDCAYENIATLEEKTQHYAEEFEKADKDRQSLMKKLDQIEKDNAAREAERDQGEDDIVKITKIGLSRIERLIKNINPSGRQVSLPERTATLEEDFSKLHERLREHMQRVEAACAQPQNPRPHPGDGEAFCMLASQFDKTHTLHRQAFAAILEQLEKLSTWQQQGLTILMNHDPEPARVLARLRSYIADLEAVALGGALL